jgi:hypothetical protein
MLFDGYVMRLRGLAGSGSDQLRRPNSQTFSSSGLGAMTQHGGVRPAAAAVDQPAAGCVDREEYEGGEDREESENDGGDHEGRS